MESERMNNFVCLFVVKGAKEFFFLVLHNARKLLEIKIINIKKVSEEQIEYTEEKKKQ